MNNKSLAIFAMHPVPYSSPLYDELYKINNNSIVYYLDKLGIKTQYNPYFGKETSNEIIIVKGHKHQFLHNLSRNNITGFFSRINLSVIFYLLFKKYDFVLINGYQTFSSWLILILSFISNKKIIFKGETIKIQNNKIKKILTKFFLNRSYIVLYSCKGNYNSYISLNISKKKLLSCPSCVNYDYFQNVILNPILERKNIFIKSLNLNPNIKIISFVSKFIERKNPLELINAVSRSNNNLIIIFAGNGPLREDIIEECSKLKINYRITDFLDQERLAYLYMITDLYVNCSIYDASPKTLNEAIFFNIPIVCPDNVGQANDLIYNGSNGYTYKQGDIDELTSKIDKALIINREVSKNINHVLVENTHAKKSAKRIIDKLND